MKINTVGPHSTSRLHGTTGVPAKPCLSSLKDGPRVYAVCHTFINADSRQDKQAGFVTRSGMNKIKITLSNGDITDVKCSVLFMKHIQGFVCMPEHAINEKLQPEDGDVFKDREEEEFVDLVTNEHLPYASIHIINFHFDDLPFTYASVDEYARNIIQYVAQQPEATITSVATAVHGPGAGLDVSEAMEKMIMAFASELQARGVPGGLNEIIFIEKDKSVFERLRQRIAFLVRTNVLLYNDSQTYLVTGGSATKAEAFGTDTIELTKKHVFVAMPFDRNFDDVYLYCIKQAVEKNGRVSERTDQEFFTGDIIERIKMRIVDSELIIADISGNNPNVFYEIGLADGMGLLNLAKNSGESKTAKKIIFITQEEKAPFDIQNQNRIKYDRLAIHDLEEKLEAAIGAILKSS